jgi:hypothetical protein
MRRAICIVKDREPYPQKHLVEGLQAAGFSVTSHIPLKPQPDDMLVMWNRHGGRNETARMFEKAGCPVIVTENGWVGREPGRKFYALCLNHHNGAGTWKVGGPERWDSFNITLAPWREKGKHILMLPSRGIGEPGIAQPKWWTDVTYEQLTKLTKRPIRVRPHPGDSNASIERDLENCHAVVTWASGAAIKAIAAGIPAFYSLPNWIGAGAALDDLKQIEEPFLGDRLPMFRRLAWAQWTAAEISTGEPIKWLMSQSM